MLNRPISTVVLSTTLAIPALTTRLLVDWEREMKLQLDLQPGDVESLPLHRARLRWPDYAVCVQAAVDWMNSLGLPNALNNDNIALMACRGARYHHDAELYGDSAFYNLFLSEDKGLDVHFPTLNLRIPLQRGTAIIFDTAQPHAVIPRTGSNFDIADFPPKRDCSQVFLTWELPLANANLAELLQIRS